MTDDAEVEAIRARIEELEIMQDAMRRMTEMLELFLKPLHNIEEDQAS